MKQVLQFGLSIAVWLLSILAVADAADPNFCAQYARSAVSQADALSTMDCFKGYDGTWHLNYQRHYGWCLTADVSAVDAQRNYRRARLAQCQGGSG